MSGVSSKRSKLMSRIHGKNTDPEKRLRSALWAKGFRYRIHSKTPAGRPDVVFPGKKVAIFVDGCFWHGCPNHYVFPRTRQDFWLAKLNSNIIRDEKQTKQLYDAGWSVIRIWEHEIYENLEHVINLIEDAIISPAPIIKAGWRVKSIVVPEHDREIEKRYLVNFESVDQSKIDIRVRNTKKWTRPKNLYGEVKRK